jgi:hypothetical protein
MVGGEKSLDRLSLSFTEAFELLADPKRQYPTIPKLVLSLYPEDQYANGNAQGRCIGLSEQEPETGRRIGQGS